MKKLLTSGWLVPVLGALLYMGTTAVLLKPGSLKFPEIKPVHVEDEDEAGAILASTPWDFRSPEIDRLIAELKDRQKTLDEREGELNEYAARLAVERAELNSVTQEVYQLQKQFNEVVTYVSQQEADIQKRQAKVFAAMTPDDASRVLSEMPDDRIVRLLMFMSEEEMAKILALLAKGGPENARRAAKLSEKLRLSVQAPPANKQTAAPAGTTALSPTQELASINGSIVPDQSADFRKLARGYAAMPPKKAVEILRELQDEKMAAILAEFTEEETAPFLVELTKADQAGAQRAARIHELLLQKLNAGNS